MKLKTCLAALLLAALLFSLPPCIAAATEPETPYPEFDFAGRGLEGVIDDFIETNKLTEKSFSMGWYDTVSGETFFYNPDTYIVAGSLYKLPLNMIYADKLAAGEITEDSVAGGWKVGSAMKASLVSSNNKAAQALHKGLGLSYTDYRNALAQYSGIPLEELPDPYYKDNRISARFMLNTLKALWDGGEKYAQIIDYMKQAMPAHYFCLTRGDYEIAHKYGSFDGSTNDCGIVYTPRPFLLVGFFHRSGNGEVFLGELCRIMTAYSLYLSELDAAQPEETEPPVEETPAPVEETPVPETEPPLPEPPAEETPAPAEEAPRGGPRTAGLILCGALLAAGLALLLLLRSRRRLFALPLLILGLAGLGLLLSACGAAPEAPAPTETPLPAVTPSPTPEPTPEPTPTPTPEPVQSDWTLSFAGDCTIGTLHAWQNKKSAGNMLYVVGEDYAYPFSNVHAIFEDDDFTMVNLEGALTESTRSRHNKEFCFRAPTAYAEVLTLGSVEAVTLANNHVLDYQEIGLEETKQTLDGRGILWTDSAAPLITELPGGFKLGVISFNTVEISIRSGSVDAYMELMQPCYDQCVEAGCDLIFAFLHWGWEYHKNPEPWQVDFAHRLADMGCDLILASHAHILEPVEIYNGTKIFYSLGNFCYGGNSNPKDKDSVIVRQHVSRGGDGVIVLGETELIPCRISSVGNANDFRPTPYEEGGPDWARVLEKLGLTE